MHYFRDLGSTEPPGGLFTYFCIGTQYFSDHFPVICTLQLHALNMDIPNSHYNDNFTSSWYKYNLKDTLKIDFINKFRHLYTDF